MKRTISLIVAVLAIIIPLLACGSTAGNTGTAVTQTTSSSPTASTQFKVGDLVKLGSWTIKVNQATTSNGDSFTTPKSGNTFLVVNVTATNTASTAQNISSALNFKLSDSTGQSYNEAITSFTKPAPDGSVAANSPVTGEMAYEVPSAQHSFTFIFQPDLASTDMATFALSD